jgi:glycine/serine hydroxymethyltransferase
MKEVARLIITCLKNAGDIDVAKKLKQEVIDLCKGFPVYSSEKTAI